MASHQGHARAGDCLCRCACRAGGPPGSASAIAARRDRRRRRRARSCQQWPGRRRAGADAGQPGCATCAACTIARARFAAKTPRKRLCASARAGAVRLASLAAASGLVRRAPGRAGAMAGTGWRHAGRRYLEARLASSAAPARVAAVGQLAAAVCGRAGQRASACHYCAGRGRASTCRTCAAQAAPGADVRGEGSDGSVFQDVRRHGSGAARWFVARGFRA